MKLCEMETADLIAELRRRTPRHPQWARPVLELVARMYETAPEVITQPANRCHGPAEARHVAMALLYHLRQDKSLPEIAALFGQDHTLVVYAARKVDRMARRDAGFSARLGEVIAALNQMPGAWSRSEPRRRVGHSWQARGQTCPPPQRAAGYTGVTAAGRMTVPK